MKYTKDFEKWWDAGYGLMDDTWLFNGASIRAAKRVAYRAYKKGIKDQKKKMDKT